MKTNRIIAFVLSAALSLSLAGCRGGKTEERERVTVALWSDQLTESYAGYLRDKFPDVEFEFYAATNSTDFYRFKQERGDLPDILTVRRFSLNDVADWKESLMDLSSTELAYSFYESYLRNYTYSDGTVNWLPAGAEVDGILMNGEMLGTLGIELPTNYGEFTDVCSELKEQGMRPFLSNFGADYTCMEILQGLSASALTSQEGREWRQLYESGQTDKLSEEVWLPVFERMLEFIELAEITPDDMGSSHSAVFDAYSAGKTAMMRATADEAKQSSVDAGSFMAPYYGATEMDNHYLTYPAFQVAANISAEKSPERRKLILDIMTAMLNRDGLESIAGGQDMISYRKDVDNDFSDILSGLQPHVDGNRLYIRLASSEMFYASERTVQGMITGEYPDARSAFDAFNEAMLEKKAEYPVVAHIDEGYPYAFDPDKGSPAASAVMNSLREELGTQLLIGQSINVAGNISAGDYTAPQLGFLTIGETVGIILCDMSAEQLRQYIGAVLDASGTRGAVINDSTLYVSSGFEMEIKKTNGGYRLERLTINGEEPDEAVICSVAVVGNETFMQREMLAAAGITDYTLSDASFKQIVADRLAGGKQLAKPTDYITLR